MLADHFLREPHCCVPKSLKEKEDPDDFTIKDEPTSEEIRKTVGRLLGGRTKTDDFFKALKYEE